MIKIKKNNLLFILSNILYFLSILFTYIDLKNFSIVDSVYPNQFSFQTYFIIFLFLTNLFFIYFFESNNIFKIFNIFTYYLVLSSGIYILNFPIMDELILIISSIFFLIQFFIKKKIFYNKKSIFFILILTILFIQSIIGLYHDYRSLRYFVIYPSLIITFFYFSELNHFDKVKQNTFFNYVFFSILIYVIYQFLFWFLKFYVFEMKFEGQKFIGNMQPSFALSASGHFDVITILSGYLILRLTINSQSIFKRSLLFFSIIGFWIFADARSSLLILILVIIFYFLLASNLKKLILISIIYIFIFQLDYLENNPNKYLKRAVNITKDVLNFKTETTVRQSLYKLQDNEYFYEEKIVPAYRDFGRLAFVLGGVYSLKHDPHLIIFGCGFYGYYKCAETGRRQIFQKYNISYNENIFRGFGGNRIRPPSAGTILVENGLIIIFMFVIYYCNFLIKNFKKNNKKLLFEPKKILLSFYLFIAILLWTIFSSITDIIFIYLFMIPYFIKQLIKID